MTLRNAKGVPIDAALALHEVKQGRVAAMQGGRGGS
jgi:hypothetical protein